ncbi:NAD-dependent epimerase/dehydratase family protein [Oxalobacteraceae bacterium OM1]|nr:NAD-dependent epimerase/dehydratase family protein [Oxalobacteraceae bacterium OM1]
MRASHPGRVLLTGANGFTGRYVRAELEAAGHTVIDAVVGAPAGPGQVMLDITSLDNCGRVMDSVRPDYLVHLAAISFVGHADAEAFYRVNVIGTLNLFQGMADAGVKLRRALVASSANVYGNATAGVIAETQTPCPVNHYAVSKLAMEHMVRTWADRVPVVITRPFNYTGVGQAPHFLVPKIVSHFMQRAPVIELGNLDVERDFSDVRRVAAIYRRLLESDCENEIVNVCSGRPYSLRDIVKMMQQIAGYEIEVRVNPAFVRQSEVKTLIGSVDKLNRLAGDVPVIPLDETLRWMATA